MVATIAAVLAVASIAWACTTPSSLLTVRGNSTTDYAFDELDDLRFTGKTTTTSGIYYIWMYRPDIVAPAPSVRPLLDLVDEDGDDNPAEDPTLAPTGGDIRGHLCMNEGENITNIGVGIDGVFDGLWPITMTPDVGLAGEVVWFCGTTSPTSPRTGGAATNPVPLLILPTGPY